MCSTFQDIKKNLSTWGRVGMVCLILIAVVRAALCSQAGIGGDVSDLLVNHLSTPSIVSGV